jgi:hypothetical protein
MIDVTLESSVAKKPSPKLYLSSINQMGRNALLTVCRIVQADTTKTAKGGITVELTCAQLRGQIQQRIGQGLFPERRERLAQFLSEWMPSELDSISNNELEPESRVHELIEDIRNALAQIEDLVQLELIQNWIENPGGDCDDYIELDATAEQLGFSYEEIDEEFVLIAPSHEALCNRIDEMSNSDFYHSVIALAGMALPLNQFSDPPTMFNAGYKFLRELTDYLQRIAENSHG